MELRNQQFEHYYCSGSRRISTTLREPAPLHRIATVMEQEGLTARTVARRMGTTVSVVMAQANPSCDMLLSELYHWQAALRVPVANLLTDSEDSLAPALLLRTKLLKVMRFVRSIQEQSSEKAIQTLANQLADMLTELMPELKEVSAWPTVGQRRQAHEMGAIAENVIPAKLFHANGDSLAES